MSSHRSIFKVEAEPVCVDRLTLILKKCERCEICLLQIRTVQNVNKLCYLELLLFCSDICGLQPCGFIAVLFMKTAEIPADTFTAAHSAIKTRKIKDMKTKDRLNIMFFIITVLNLYVVKLLKQTLVCFRTSGEKSEPRFTKPCTVWQCVRWHHLHFTETLR